VHRYRQHLREARGDATRSTALLEQHRALLERWAALDAGLRGAGHDTSLLPPPTWGQPRPGREARGGPLTAREWEVARLVSRGLRNAEIAEALVLEPGTVANHVRHILAKLGLRSRTELAAWVLRQGQGGSEA
jgi:DNA-binding NarL/FixJ family response regulator